MSFSDECILFKFELNIPWNMISFPSKRDRCYAGYESASRRIEGDGGVSVDRELEWGSRMVVANFNPVAANARDSR